MRELEMTEQQALGVIRSLTRSNFHKSMTTYTDHKVWQDVYFSEWNAIPLYIKFQMNDEYFVISFKEREAEVI
jgi:motility quorum-sensing regulator / GCU-specific mRNA interferase toxin